MKAINKTALALLVFAQVVGTVGHAAGAARPAMHADFAKNLSEETDKVKNDNKAANHAGIREAKGANVSARALTEINRVLERILKQEAAEGNKSASAKIIGNGFTDGDFRNISKVQVERIELNDKGEQTIAKIPASELLATTVDKLDAIANLLDREKNPNLSDSDRKLLIVKQTVLLQSLKVTVLLSKTTRVTDTLNEKLAKIIGPDEASEKEEKDLLKNGNHGLDKTLDVVIKEIDSMTYDQASSYFKLLLGTSREAAANPQMTTDEAYISALKKIYKSNAVAKKVLEDLFKCQAG